MSRYYNEKRIPEILAPAGTIEALEAAVKAGADAVYVGGSLYSARAFAGNFGPEEMLRAIDFCHLYGAKLYMAVNTLLKTDEIGQLSEYMRPYYSAGVDGVIVQDMGVAKVLHEAYPDLPLHGSTQMSVSSRWGASFLKDCGFTRVVPARELSLEEIKQIKNATDIEIESFVHGAMCFAYSGKCLMSSFIGGRSGNRGRCAQPCRQCYEIDRKSKAYILSLKDMCTLRELPELIDAGIDSFKIEGRMKKPEYVAATTDAYRRARDMYLEGRWDDSVIEKMILDMQDIYNRGGFSNGYYYRKNGQAMFADRRPNHTGVMVGKVSKVEPPKVMISLERAVNAQDVLEIRGAQDRAEGVELTSPVSAAAGTQLTLNGKEFKKIKAGAEVYRTRNNQLIDEIREKIIEPEITREATAHVTAHIGEPLTIVLSCVSGGGEVSVSVEGGTVQAAARKATGPADVLEKMGKTGGSGLTLEVTCDMDEGVFLPMSELNELRRRAMDELKANIADRYRR